MYEATQHQRQIERSIRRQKWRIAADEGAGDSEKLQEDKTRLTQLRREYRDFSNAAGLRQQNDRLFTATGSGKEAVSTLTGQPNGGIIEKNDTARGEAGRAYGWAYRQRDIQVRDRGHPDR